MAMLAWRSTAFAQVRIVNYNVNASNPAETGPRDGMDTVLSAINASAKGGFAHPIDILLLQEGFSVSTTGSAYASLLNTITGGTSYRRSSTNGGTTGSGRPMAVYNSAAVTLVGEALVGSTASQPRQTLRYQFRPVGYDASADFYVYASHFKASDTSADEADRNTEARANRANADALGDGTSIVYAGDFNFYSSSESGFQTLTGTGAGQAFDPINRLGSWSDASSFRDVHTQSPATTAVFDGQVTAGMDDRFDFQLVSGELLDGRGVDVVAGSYWAFGNTGSHTLNGAITTGNASTLASRIPGYSTSQAQAVLTALASASDHIPVVADYQLPAKLSANVASLPSTVIRGAGVSAALTVSNAAPVAVAAGADRLDYLFSGGGVVAGSGTGSDLALGGGNAHGLAVDTSLAGLRTGTVSVTATSPQAASATFSQAVSLGVLDHAAPSFASGAAQSLLEFDFGTLSLGDGPAARSFDIVNRAGTLGGTWTAKLDLDEVLFGGSSGIFGTTVSSFSGLAAGGSHAHSVSMTPSAVGTFSGTYTLRLSDENLPGATTHTLGIAVRGSVVQPGPVDRVFDVAIGQTASDISTIGGQDRLVKRGPGTLVRSGSGSFTGGTTVEAGSLVVASASALGSGALTVAPDAEVVLETAAVDVSVLDLQPGGRIDLGTGRLTVLPGGIDPADLRALLLDGRNGGAWDGSTGIVSSDALGAANGRAVGYRVLGSGTSVTGFAAFGDMNLDGQVNSQDLNLLLAGGRYGTSARDAGWWQGDFNYDGLVNTQDLNLLLAAGLYGQGNYLPAASGVVDGGFTSAAVAAVPEPSGVGLVAIGAVGVAALVITSSGGGTSCRRRRRPRGRPSRSSRAPVPR